MIATVMRWTPSLVRNVCAQRAEAGTQHRPPEPTLLSWRRLRRLDVVCGPFALRTFPVSSHPIGGLIFGSAPWESAPVPR